MSILGSLRPNYGFLRNVWHFMFSSPSRLVIFVFLGLIALFTFLLSLPFALAPGVSGSGIDALFTAVSAICVTGLATVDMATHWSEFGQIIIFIGVNIGGMGVITFASLMALAVSRRLSLRTKLLAAGDNNPLRAQGGTVNENQTIRLGEIGKLLLTVALSTIVVEITLAFLLYPALVVAGVAPLTALWEAPYYAAMSFTNTGFTPNPGGLSAFSENYLILSLLMAGVFLGSIGFPVIYTVVTQRWHIKRWSLHTRLTLITTILLFILGGALFFFLEYSNQRTLEHLDVPAATFQAFFFSAMTRSGGFSVINVNDMQGSSLLLGCILMFVGGGSASTAGGIKVTTLAVLVLVVWAEARGRSSVQAFGRRIPSDVQRVALSVFAWGTMVVLLATLVIAQLSDAPLRQILFEVISGFATAGLSTGLTAELSDSASVILALTIVMGRIGTVTLAAAIAGSTHRQLYALPTERPIVG